MEIEPADTNENYEAAVLLTQGKKYLSLVTAAPYTTITKEARIIANAPERYENTVAQAIVVKTLANRLMGNLLIKFYNPPCPCVLFTNKEKAVEWLQEEWEKAHVSNMVK